MTGKSCEEFSSVIDLVSPSQTESCHEVEL
jgi:hypothetical protein